MIKKYLIAIYSIYIIHFDGTAIDNYAFLFDLPPSSKWTVCSSSKCTTNRWCIIKEKRRTNANAFQKLRYNGRQEQFGSHRLVHRSCGNRQNWHQLVVVLRRQMCDHDLRKRTCKRIWLIGWTCKFPYWYVHPIWHINMPYVEHALCGTTHWLSSLMFSLLHNKTSIAPASINGINIFVQLSNSCNSSG